MIKNKLSIKRIIWSLLLTLAMVISVTVPALPVNAEGGGIISIVYDPPHDQATDFKLYKAAEYGHDASGKVTLDLVAPFAGHGIDLNDIVVPEEPTDPDERAKWQADWLNAASELANYVSTEGSGTDTVWEGSLHTSDVKQTLMKDGQAVVFPNAIYLLVGHEQLIDDEYWVPVPVLIQVLNDETVFYMDKANAELKFERRPEVRKHSVTKSWKDDSYKEGRPDSVRVGIYYGDIKVDTVELSDGNNWTYTWYSSRADRVYTSKDPEDPASEGVTTEVLNSGNSYRASFPDGDSLWRVAELEDTRKKSAADSSYNWSITRTGTDVAEHFSITNTLINPAIHNPPVLKTVKGDEPDKDETFEFEMKAVSTTANTEMPMPEGSAGDTKTIKTKAGTEKEFGDIIFRTPGEYYYEISEVDTGIDGYKYDTSVYSLHYTVSVNGNNLEVKLVTSKNGKEVETAKYSFVNEYSDSGSKKVKTGDETNLVLPIAALAAALILLIILVLKRRKNNRDDE